MRMRSLILYVISCYGVYKCVCFCTMISWCSVKASATILNSPRSPRNVTLLFHLFFIIGHPYIPLEMIFLYLFQSHLLLDLWRQPTQLMRVLVQ